MKYILPLLFFLVANTCKAQFINCKVKDAETNQALYYATIYYGKPLNITFSDSAGNFFVRNEMLASNDSVKIEFIGYQTQTIRKRDIHENAVFALYKKTSNLQEVIVKPCKEYEEKKVDYDYGKPDSYWTVSPNFKGMYIAHYSNEKKLQGFITNIIIYSPSFTLIPSNFSIPLRLHWFEWDKIKNEPGRELTDTSILLFAYKHGKNKIEIPDKKIYFDEEGVTIGLEFLFPNDIEKKYLTIQTEKEKHAFIDKNTWSFGMAANKTNEPCFFQSMISGKIQEHKTQRNSNELKPALNFTIKTCKD